MLSEILIQIIFGWPAIVTSILLSIAGVWLKKPALLVAAGVICIPFTYYLSGFRTPAVVLLPFSLFGSAYAIRAQRPLLAWLLIAPLIVIAALLAYAVLTQ
jgi:hypothetical protein